MDGAAAYLEHATRASSSEDDVEEEPSFRSAFAALAVDDHASDDHASDNHAFHGPCEPRRARASSTPSSSGSDDEREGAWFPPDATADEIVAAASAPGADGSPAWAWSTGRAGASARGATRRADEARRQKKPLLAKGEKRLLKKRHMAEMRAARSAKRHGFTPADVKAAFERLVAGVAPNAGEGEGEGEDEGASSSTKASSAADADAWRPPNGGVCGVREAKTIAALARCFPGLRFVAVRGRSNEKRVRVEVTVERVPSLERRAGVAPPGSREGAATRAEAAAAVDAAERDAARASAIAAPPPTREAFLNDPARLARLAKIVGARRRAGPDRRDVRRAPPTTRAGRRGAGAYNAPEGASSRGGRRRDASAATTRREDLFASNPALGLGAMFAAGGTLPEGGEGGAEVTAGDDDDADGDADRRGGPASRSSAPASARPRTDRGAGGDAFGAFERHTSGFGGRMLAQMGFTPGEGLGKEKTGMAEPVEATARAKRLGLGATE